MTNRQGRVVIDHIHLYQLYMAAMQWLGDNRDNANYPYVKDACVAAKAVLYPGYSAVYDATPQK